MDVFEGGSALPLLISNVVTIMLIVFFGRDRHQQRNAYKHQLARLEAKALIAQMNPHFIFNTLNGIQSTMVLKGEKEANRYIGIFSSLLRKTLDMSALQKVPLSEEIEYIKGYITLQEMRLKHPIKTKYNIDKKLDLEESKIPVMMMQPLIENAILHGISPLKKSGELILNFGKKKDRIVIEIIDNGVGRKRAQLYQSAIKIRERNRPSASEIISDRIDIYNYIEKTNSEFKLEDRLHKGEVVGTIATLIIPTLIDITQK